MAPQNTKSVAITRRSTNHAYRHVEDRYIEHSGLRLGDTSRVLGWSGVLDEIRVATGLGGWLAVSRVRIVELFRRGIYLVLVIAGVVLWEFFGFSFGPALVAVGFTVLVSSLVRDRRFVATTAVVFFSVGLIVIPPIVMNRQPDLPTLETVPQSANEYVLTLAEGDFESYRDTVNHVYGVTVEDAFRVESGCIDWSTATVSVAPNGVSPMVAYVTFSDGYSSIARDFQYVVAKDFFQRFSGRWVPTVDDNC